MRTHSCTEVVRMSGWPVQEFDAFVASRLPALVRFAYALTGDLGHAEDLVQTALVKTYLATRRHAPDAPEAYVRRVIVTANLSRFRRRRVVEDLVDPLPEALVVQRERPSEQRAALADLLAELSPRQRTVMVLRYQQDWPEAEIAAAMGVSTGTVKTLAIRSRARARRRNAVIGVAVAVPVCIGGAFLVTNGSSPTSTSIPATDVTPTPS